MFISRNSQWEGSFPVGRELPGEKGASGRKRAARWERSFLVVESNFI